jgi:hypothetical protein
MSTLLSGTLYRETEFVGGLTGACGPNALASCASWATQQRVTTLDVYRTMREPSALCDANGVSTIGGLHDATLRLGLPLLDTRWYAEPWSDWSSWLSFHVSRGRAILVELANGQALVDSVSGQGENARNLKYHFLAVLGRHDGGSSMIGTVLPAGWWCADGANVASGNVLQCYPDDVMAAAQPCAALAIGAQTVSNPYTVTKGPDGSTWYQDSRTGKSVGGGIYAKYVAPHGFPICTAGEHDAPGDYGARGDKIALFGDPHNQQAVDHVAYWERSTGNVTDGWDAHLVSTLEAVVTSLTKQLADAKAAAGSSATTNQTTVLKQVKALVAPF